MRKSIAVDLFEQITGDLLQRPDVKAMDPDQVLEDLILWLDHFDECSYDKRLPADYSFGVYEGDWDVLMDAVRAVSPDWVQYYSKDQPVMCAYDQGKPVAFCILDDFGEATLEGHTVKVGAPGCVGTLPEYRDRGLGLIMVREATKWLRDAGYDMGYIMYTSVGGWYRKLGYQTLVRWNREGVVESFDEVVRAGIPSIVK